MGNCERIYTTFYQGIVPHHLAHSTEFYTYGTDVFVRATEYKWSNFAPTQANADSRNVIKAYIYIQIYIIK